MLFKHKGGQLKCEGNSRRLETQTMMTPVHHQHDKRYGNYRILHMILNIDRQQGDSEDNSSFVSLQNAPSKLIKIIVQLLHNFLSTQALLLLSTISQPKSQVPAVHDVRLPDTTSTNPRPYTPALDVQHSDA